MRRLLFALVVFAVSVLRADITSDQLHDELLPIIQELNDLESQLVSLDQDLVSKFGTNHNDLQAVRTAINDAKGSIDNAVSHLGTLNSNINTLLDRVNAGNSTLTSINQGVSGLLSTIDDVLTATRAVKTACESVYSKLYDFKDAFDVYASSSADALALLHQDGQDLFDILDDIFNQVNLFRQETRYSLAAIDQHLATGLGDVLQRLAVLSSISDSTANTYTNVVAVLDKLNSGVVVDTGPTTNMTLNLSNRMTHGLKWYNYASDSVLGDNHDFPSDVFINNLEVPAGGWNYTQTRLLQGLFFNTKQQRKSGIISALADVWTTNYLGSVQQPLLVDQLAAAEAQTNYLYSVQADMLRAITNSLANLNATNNQQSAQTEEAYAEMAASVSNQVASLDMDQNADRFVADTAGFTPSFSSDALSAFDSVKSGLGDFATRSERKAQDAASGVRLGITLPQYTVGETTLLNGDEFLGASGNQGGEDGLHAFFTAVRSVFLAVWTVAYLGVAFALWRFLVGLWHRITSLFGETVDKSMMV